MRKKFMSEFEIVKMSNKSLVCIHKQSGIEVYIHKDMFNQLDFAEDYRLVDRNFSGNITKWIELLVWKSI